MIQLLQMGLPRVVLGVVSDGQVVQCRVTGMGVFVVCSIRSGRFRSLLQKHSWGHVRCIHPFPGKLLAQLMLASASCPCQLAGDMVGLIPP